MMHRRSVLGVLAGGAALSLGGCKVFGPSSYHYRMTIEVRTPQGVKAFSSVRAISYSKRLMGGYDARVKGEAIIMDLPGGPVFALMSGADGSQEYAEEIAEAALEAEPLPGGENRDYQHGRFAEIYPTAPSIRSYMPEDPLPLFVRFRDTNDPKSVERVDAASIGVERITVEKTGDAVTAVIANRLAIIGILPNRSLDNDFKMTTSPTLAQKLRYSDFMREQ